eukprot:1160574-Pelagomonas_calceolata.AAC.2
MLPLRVKCMPKYLKESVLASWSSPYRNVGNWEPARESECTTSDLATRCAIENNYHSRTGFWSRVIPVTL